MDANVIDYEHWCQEAVTFLDKMHRTELSKTTGIGQMPRYCGEQKVIADEANYKQTSLCLPQLVSQVMWRSDTRLCSHGCNVARCYCLE